MGKKLENKSLSRVSFLAEQYNVITSDEFNTLVDMNDSSNEVISNLNENGIDIYLAIISSIIKKESTYEGNSVISYKRTIKIHEDIFVNMVQADPTANKIYLQWMLNIFVKLMKENVKAAIRFACEDLILANEYLLLFENNKRKQLFKTLCKGNSDLLKISDPTNINQYRNLSQVYDVVDPFIERDPSTLELAFKRFVNSGQAELPVRDRFFTVYVPISDAANEVLSKFTNWCTTRSGQGMVKTYTNMKTPKGNKSKLYVIIDNKFFKEESDDLWQIHFESLQIMDRKDNPEKNLYDKVFEKSEVLSKYFYNELIENAKLVAQSDPPSPKTKKVSNLYLNYLSDFGFPEAKFDVLSDYVPLLAFTDDLIPKIPDVKRFKSVELIYIANSKLKELDSSICSLTNLKQLSIPQNKIEELPDFIGECKNLIFINLIGNKIKYIPQNISKLDPSNGGKLIKMSVKKEDVGDDNFNKLKKLLPNVELEFSI